MFTVSSCIYLCPIYWSHVLSRKWRCSWSSADRRCSNYIWVINNLMAHKDASCIRDLTVDQIWLHTDTIVLLCLESLAKCGAGIQYIMLVKISKMPIAVNLWNYLSLDKKYAPWKYIYLWHKPNLARKMYVSGLVISTINNSARTSHRTRVSEIQQTKLNKTMIKQ